MVMVVLMLSDAIPPDWVVRPLPSLCIVYCRSFSLELAWRAGYLSLELSETLYSPGGTLRLAPRASHPMVSSRALETESQATADPQRTLSPESRKAKQIKNKDKEHAPEPSQTSNLHQSLPRLGLACFYIIFSFLPFLAFTRAFMRPSLQSTSSVTIVHQKSLSSSSFSPDPCSLHHLSLSPAHKPPRRSPAYLSRCSHDCHYISLRDLT